MTQKRAQHPALSLVGNVLWGDWPRNPIFWLPVAALRMIVGGAIILGFYMALVSLNGFWVGTAAGELVLLLAFAFVVVVGGLSLIGFLLRRAIVGVWEFFAGMGLLPDPPAFLVPLRRG